MPTANYIAPTTNTSSVERGNALTLWSGEVLTSFRRSTLFWDIRNTFCNIKIGFGGRQSDVWPVIGSDPDAEHHIPGNMLQGQQQATDKITVTIDDFIVGHRFIPGDDNIVSHFDVSQPYAASIGRQLGNSADDKLVRTLILAARSAASTGFHLGGNIVNRTGGGTTIADAYPSSSTGATNGRGDMRTLAYQMDVDEVPVAGRNMAITPYFRSVLQYDTTIFSRDYQVGQNDALSRKIGECEGFNLFVSMNSIPAEAFYAPRGPRFDATKYDVDTRYLAGNIAASTGQPVAIAFCGAQEGNGAVAVLIAEEMYTEISYSGREGGTFMMGRNFLGAGKLAVWEAGVIQGQLS